MFRFRDYLSLFAAEVLSILQALRWVDDNGREAIVFTDSVAATEAIEAGANKSRDDIVSEIINIRYVSQHVYCM